MAGNSTGCVHGRPAKLTPCQPRSRCPYFSAHLAALPLNCKRVQRQEGHGECPACQSSGFEGAVRATTHATVGGSWRGDAGVTCPKKTPVPAGRGRDMIRDIQRGLQEDGHQVSISQLCRWFDVSRRTLYYRPTLRSPKIQERFSVPIK